MSIIIILMTIGVYMTYRTIVSNIMQEQLVLLFFMTITTILILYTRNRVEEELERDDDAYQL